MDESSLTKEKINEELAVWKKIAEESSDMLLEIIYPEKYLQKIFGEYAEEILKYSGNPDLPDWIRGLAAENIAIIMNVFNNFLAANLSDSDENFKLRLRSRLIERITDYLNLSIGNWLEVANWKFVVVLDGKEPKIAFIHDDEVLKIKRR